MKVIKCPRMAGFDASTYIEPYTGKEFFEAGYRFVFRYLNRTKHFRDTPDNSWPVSLSVQELRELTDRGFGVGLVQFAGSCNYGKDRGEAAAHNAMGLCIPRGVHLFCDAEGWPGKTWAEVKQYLDEWQAPVLAAGYRAGLYVGPGVDFGADPGPNLYSLRGYTSYWRAASYVPSVAVRGYSLTQGTQEVVFGQTIDQDICAMDHRGGRPYVVGK